jgi:hypothetical protein
MYLPFSHLLLSFIFLKGPKTQTLLSQDPETHVAGEGEDYFLSLFGDSKKLISRSSHVQETCKHFSMILEEVGQSISRYTLYLNV